MRKIDLYSFQKALLLLLVGSAMACSPAQKTSEEAATSPQENWDTLFDGQTLTGWEKRGGEAPYRIENGEIIGTSMLNTPNTFMCTQDSFKNFVLELEVMVTDTNFNSGIQIRSKERGPSEKEPNGRVYGYQIEIDPKVRAWSGGLYEEAARGWLFPLKGDDLATARTAFKVGEWNRYRIESTDQTIKTWINEIPVTDFTDTVDVGYGFIGLQVHSTQTEYPMEVRWRNIRIQRKDALGQ